MEGNKKAPIKNRFISRLIAYWPVLLLLILLSIVGSWYYLQSFSPLYRAAIKIAIRGQQVDQDTPKIADSVINTFQSEELSTHVVYHLQLYAEIFKKGTVKDNPAYANTPLFIAADKTVPIEHREKVEMAMGNSAVIVDHNRHPLNKWGYTAFGKFKFVKNPRFKGDGKNEFYISFVPVKQAAENILSRLHVSASAGSPGIINLSIEDEVPQRAEDILNSLVKVYNASHREVQITNPGYDLKMISRRIANVENDLLAIEKKLQERKNQDSAARGGIIQQQKAEIAVYTNLLQKKETAALALTLPAPPPISIVNANVLPVITAPVPLKVYFGAILAAMMITMVIIAVREATRRKARMALAYEGDYANPADNIVEDEEQIATLNERLNKLKNNIKKSISWDRLIREDFEQSVMPVNEITTGDTVNSPVFINKQRDLFLERLAKLQRIIEAWADFKFFTKNNKPALSETPDKIILYKSMDEPVVAKGQRMSIMARLNNLKIDKKEAENFKPAPEYELVQPVQETISVEPIPIIAQEELLRDKNQNISIAEQFSRLRKTLGELGINGDRKKVMITSAVPGEGKDFVAANLALSLALTGKKVVLLDFDIHQPSLGNKLGVKQKTGISDYLKGKARFDDIILATEIDKNLFFIPAGQVTGQEYELKMNDLVMNMLNQLSSSFDHIIISAAPVRPFADAYSLSPLCDATLYIVRHAFSPKTFIEKFNKFNILNRLKNAAVIFNEA